MSVSCIYLVSCLSPPNSIFFKVSHWPLDHMIRSQPLIGLSELCILDDNYDNYLQYQVKQKCACCVIRICRRHSKPSKGLILQPQNSITLNICSSRSKSASILLKRLRKNNWNSRHNLHIFLDILEPKVQN